MFYNNKLDLIIENNNKEFIPFFTERCHNVKDNKLKYQNKMIIDKDIKLIINKEIKIFKNVERSDLFQIYNNILGYLINNQNNLYIHSTLISKNNYGILILGNFGQGKTYLSTYAKEMGFELNSSDQTWIHLEVNDLYLKQGSSFVKEGYFKYNLNSFLTEKPIKIIKIVILYGLCDEGKFAEKTITNKNHIYKRLFPFANWHYLPLLQNENELLNSDKELKAFFKNLNKLDIPVSTIWGDKQEIINKFKLFLIENDREDDLNFIKGLQENNSVLLKSAAKADMHIHGALGADFKQFDLPDYTSLKGYQDMKNYINQNITKLSDSKDKYRKMLKLTIENAQQTGVTSLEMSIDIRYYINFFNNIADYINDINQLKNEYPNVNFDIGISKTLDDEYLPLVEELIKTRIFNGIDLYGDEKITDLAKFESIYKLAKNYHLRRKIHIGEYYKNKISESIYLLNPTVIQHGLSIIKNKNKDQNNIFFNVSTISNIKLGIIKNIKKHPIKKMFENGLKLTLSTDDPLIFRNTINDEYILLYQNKVFTAEELNLIRKMGIYN